MNNTFNINRFSKLLQKELKEFPKRFGYSILGIFIVYFLYRVALFFLPTSFESSNMTSFSLMVFWILTVVAVVVPYKCYGTVNNNKLGLDYAQLPASSFEKTLSMFIITFFVSLLSIFIAIQLIDVVFYLINPAKAGLPSICFMKSVPFVLMQVISLFLLNAEFALGNLIFHKNKVSKTILCLFAIGAVFSIIGVCVITHIGLDNFTAILERYMGDFSQNMDSVVFHDDDFGALTSSLWAMRPVRIVVWSSYIYNGFFGLLCWFFSYRMIKTAKY